MESLHEAARPGAQKRLSAHQAACGDAPNWDPGAKVPFYEHTNAAAPPCGCAPPPEEATTLADEDLIKCAKVPSETHLRSKQLQRPLGGTTSRLGVVGASIPNPSGLI